MNAVEVRMVNRTPTPLTIEPVEATEPIDEFWQPATVVYVKEKELGVAFADHTRLAIRRSSNRWRFQ